MKQTRALIEIDEELCDGCGECVPACHEGALRIIDGKARLVSEALCDGLGACLGHCPRGAIRSTEREAEAFAAPSRQAPQLSHWPVQIRLVPPHAPFLRDADLVVAADCVPVALPDFHRDFVRDHAVLIGCPKFDDLQDYTLRFARLFETSAVRRVTVVVMEVPCCQSLPRAVRRGMEMAGREVPMEVVVVSVAGEELERRVVVGF